MENIRNILSRIDAKLNSLEREFKGDVSTELTDNGYEVDDIMPPSQAEFKPTSSFSSPENMPEFETDTDDFVSVTSQPVTPVDCDGDFDGSDCEDEEIKDEGVVDNLIKGTVGSVTTGVTKELQKGTGVVTGKLDAFGKPIADKKALGEVDEDPTDEEGSLASLEPDVTSDETLDTEVDSTDSLEPEVTGDDSLDTEVDSTDSLATDETGDSTENLQLDDEKTDSFSTTDDSSTDLEVTEPSEDEASEASEEGAETSEDETTEDEGAETSEEGAESEEDETDETKSKTEDDETDEEDVQEEEYDYE